ncbi:Protein of uncharacterised function (DUF3170) [Enterobacter cloacae]|nr:Protein of uncharacterised function (DUF3170) [Enterobacter cloacae]
MTIVDVFHRQFHRRTDRFRGVTHVVVRFVLGFQAVDDLHRFVNRRLGHVDFLETTRQRTILLKDVAELLVRRGAHHADLAAGEQRFDQVSGIHLATGGRTCADDGVDLIDKQNAVGVLLQLF